MEDLAKQSSKSAPKDTRKVITKRRFPRRRFNQKIGLLWEGNYTIGESIQIGEGGMLVGVQFEMKEGSSVVVSFMVPGRDFVVVRASIQYKRAEKGKVGTFFGLKFLSITFEQRRILRDFVSAKTEAEADLEGVFVK